MRITVIVLLAALLSFAACAQQQPQSVAPPDTRAADEAAIRAASKDWAAAAQAKDSEKFVSFYSEDARLMVEQGPDVVGKAAIRDVGVAMMQDPNFALNFETTKVEVARSGDIAYELGTYQENGSDPKTSQSLTWTGTFVAVWEKQADGTWKCVVDAPNSDAPPAK